MVWGWACGLDIFVKSFFCHFFYIVNSHFSPWIYEQLVPLVIAAPYSFVPIIMKLCMHFFHGMRMCMWFGYNCEIIFCHFFHIVNSHFSPFMYKQLVQLLWFCTGYYEILHAFLHEVWGCACGLDIIIRSFFPFLAHLSSAQDELLWSLFVRRPSVRQSVRLSINIFKRHLLWSRWANFAQISYGASLGWGNEKLLKWLRSINQDGCHAHIW